MTFWIVFAVVAVVVATAVVVAVCVDSKRREQHAEAMRAAGLR